ncbi:hypothetical protein [Halorubellus litoreus]|uniref:Sec-independent protein translocase protein TatA n=1 Tax=Halorubellus litoreus TaxID=755308 RepID=A0ABD5VDS9_9EURY
MVEATLLLAFVMGLLVPFQFAMERLRGLGRHFVAKLPYKPPVKSVASDAEETDEK